MLTRRGWGFVLGASASALAASVAGLRDLWFLPVFLAAVPVVAVLTVVFTRAFSGIEVRVTAANPTPHAGDTVTLTATISHRLPSAVAARLNWQIGDEQAADEVVVPARSPARGPARSARRSARSVRTASRSTRVWHANERGPARVRVRSVVFTDPFGVAEARLACGDLAAVNGALVLPRLLTGVPVRGASRVSDDESAQSGLLPPASVPPAFVPPAARFAQASSVPGGSLREYRPGDTRRMVDWKQSAKQGDLVVRAAEADDANARVLRISTRGSDYASTQAFEDAVSAVATLGVEWLSRGDAVRLVVDDEAPIDGLNERALLRLLAVLELRSGVHGANSE